jgi:hypothetical protein
MGASALQHSFSGHETFPFRYPWLKKGFDAVRDDGDVFLRDDAITTLGVGKNMVRSIRHWCLAAGVLQENREGALQATDLGTLLFADDGLDPYLEDPATLWVLHWQVASNRARATTWYWTFSHFHEPEFTREALASALNKWAQTLSGKQVAASSLKRDVEVFLRTYVPSRHSRGEVAEDSLDCPLVELKLITQPGDGQSFRFRRGSNAVSPMAFSCSRSCSSGRRSPRRRKPCPSTTSPANRAAPAASSRSTNPRWWSGWKASSGRRKARCPTGRRRGSGSSTAGSGSTRTNCWRKPTRPGGGGDE